MSTWLIVIITVFNSSAVSTSTVEIQYPRLESCIIAAGKWMEYGTPLTSPNHEVVAYRTITTHCSDVPARVLGVPQ